MKKIFALFTLLFIFSLQVFSQAKTDSDLLTAHETDARVPSLDKFHKVIYPIWHKYWPNKDWEGFKKMVPDVEKYAEDIYKAELPGILRDKKDTWNKAVEELKVCVENYKKDANNNDTTALLKSAEKLHAQYEFMVRLVNPITKELDDFHKVLYNIYHYYMPEWQFDKLKEAINELAEKAKILKDSELKKPAKFTPESKKRYDQRNEKYTKAVAKLCAEVDNVVKIMETKDKDKIKKAIEKMHSAYQATEHIFD